MRINMNDLIGYAKTLEGSILTTEFKKKEFTLKITDSGLQYTPKSSSIPRPHRYGYLKRFVDRFEEIKSFQPKDYVDISANASYALVLIRNYLSKSKPVGNDEETLWREAAKKRFFEAYDEQDAIYDDI